MTQQVLVLSRLLFASLLLVGGALAANASQYKESKISAAKALLRSGHYAQACTQLEEMQTVDEPSQRQALMLLAKVYSYSGNFSASAAAYNLLGLLSQSAQQRRYARLRVEVQDLHASAKCKPLLTIAKNLLVVGRGDVTMHRIEGECHYVMCDWNAAHASASRGLAIDPDDPSLLLLQSRVLYHSHGIGNGDQVTELPMRAVRRCLLHAPQHAGCRSFSQWLVVVATDLAHATEMAMSADAEQLSRAVPMFEAIRKRHSSDGDAECMMASAAIVGATHESTANHSVHAQPPSVLHGALAHRVPLPPPLRRHTACALCEASERVESVLSTLSWCAEVLQLTPADSTSTDHLFDRARAHVYLARARLRRSGDISSIKLVQDTHIEAKMALYPFAGKCALCDAVRANPLNVHCRPIVTGPPTQALPPDGRRERRGERRSLTASGTCAMRQRTRWAQPS